MFAKFGPQGGPIFGKGGPILAAKIGPGGPLLANFLPKSVWVTNFGGGTDFGVTGPQRSFVILFNRMAITIILTAVLESIIT